MHQRSNKQIHLLECIKVRTNRSSDKQRFGQTEVQTNRGSDKQRRPLACPPCLRKIVYFCSSYCLRIYIFFPWMHQSSNRQYHCLGCIKVIALDASKFGQTEVRTNRGSDKQKFGQTEVLILNFFPQKSFFLENQQSYIFLTLPGS